MFKINNNVTLNLHHFVILLIMIFILFSLYNKIYINDNFITYEKYKSTVKKYKIAIINYQNKINDLESIILKQNQTIDEHKQPVNQIGSHSSSHNASLTPAKFIPSTPINDQNLMTSIDKLLKIPNYQNQQNQTNEYISSQTMDATINNSLNTYWNGANNLNPF